MTEDAISPHEGVVLDALAAHLQPIRRSKVDCLGKVVAVIEARVVRARERDHELAGVLVHAVNRNPVSLKETVEYINLILTKNGLEL
jgi:hypothetical protein